MLIVIDLTDSRTHLRQPDDFSRFSVSVVGTGGAEALSEVVRQSGLGRVVDDGAQVAVDPVALRVLAGPAASAEWDQAFASMCAYAGTKGWLLDDGSILGHVERG